MKTSIFIVDDSVVARNMLINILKSDKTIEVVGESGTGQGAIIMLDEVSPDIIILEADITGGMTLLDVIKEIKGIKPDIKIILSTTVRDTKVVIPMSEAGANYFIQKPFRKVEVMMSINYVRNMQNISVN